MKCSFVTFVERLLLGYPSNCPNALFFLSYKILASLITYSFIFSLAKLCFFFNTISICALERILDLKMFHSFELQLILSSTMVSSIALMTWWWLNPCTWYVMIGEEQIFCDFVKNVSMLAFDDDVHRHPWVQWLIWALKVFISNLLSNIICFCFIQFVSVC